SLEVFILAIFMYPEAWRRAQERIDAVVSNDRSLTFAARSSVPCFEASLREMPR
ncbi:hypothetical protein BDN67DRAFT_914954, partial [Paxillus ammoniavirescens]